MALAHPELTFPGYIAHDLWQTLDPVEEYPFDASPHPLAPGALNQCAARQRPLPALVILPRRTLAPLECSEGVSPR